ncbi:MAG: hypothetical protein H8D63_02685 [Parcubacteria group bacterium]|nr:hypothetical protein [Parcubacteria group bacterium]
MHIKSTLSILGIILFVLTLGFYILYQSRDVIVGPTIELIFPENGAVLSEPYIVVYGRTENISFISLNDLPISVDEEGRFSETLLLAPGHNILELSARDRFGKETEVIREVFVEEVGNTQDVNDTI